MPKRIINFPLNVVIFLIACFALNGEQSFQKAKEVDLFLKKLRQPESSRSVFLKERTFTEEELNSYLNQIYIKEEAPEVKRINLKLSGKNKISALLYIELDSQKYPKVPTNLLKSTIKISTLIESNNNQMRLKPEEIIVNNVSFSPQLLDEIFALSQSGKEKKRSIYDWFKLFPGIKKITMESGRITFYY